jgi:hypothetical protein
MKVVRCFVRPDNTTTIICPACNEPKTISVAAYKHKKHSIKVRCKCKEIFTIQLDFRNVYRKPTNLPGKYVNLSSPDQESFDVIVTNISKTGLGFVAPHPEYLQKGQKLSIEFQLSDKKKTRLTKTIIVKNVNKENIGCQFDGNQAFEKALGFFLQR